MQLLLIAALAPVLAAADPKDPPKPRLDEKAVVAELEKVLKKHDLPALGAVILTSHVVETVAVAGVRKRGSDVKVTKEDHFHIGSNTKAMTATLIAMLVEKKVLSYDLTLEKAFPDVAAKMHPDYKNVTLEQLLTHHAGLPANLELKSWNGPVNDPIRQQRQQTAEKALTEKPFVKPGSKREYSNVGYVLAAAIAERVENVTWEEMIEKRLFAPLKMTSAGFGPMASKDKIDQPWSHGKAGKPIDPSSPPPVSDNPPVMGPAGRVHCSLDDWAKYIADQLKGAQGKDGLMPASGYRKLFLPANKGEDYSPGGWVLTPILAQFPGPWHNGSNGYNYSIALLHPKRDLAVLIVCNQNTKKGQQAALEVGDKLAEMLGKADKR